MGVANEGIDICYVEVTSFMVSDFAIFSSTSKKDVRYFYTKNDAAVKGS